MSSPGPTDQSCHQKSGTTRHHASLNVRQHEDHNSIYEDFQKGLKSKYGIKGQGK